MKAEYSKHLLHRLILRMIDHDLPRTIFEQSVEHYDDMETGHGIATEDNNMNEFKVHYDEAEDILHLGREGQKNGAVELSPVVNIELDDKGKLIGIELFNASLLFRNVLGLMGKKINQVA
jgi:uncharacterized protein YuzE